MTSVISNATDTTSLLSPVVEGSPISGTESTEHKYHQYEETKDLCTLTSRNYNVKMVLRRTLGKDFRYFECRLFQRLGEIGEWGLNALGEIQHG
jgi:hypothetical protein